MAISARRDIGILHHFDEFQSNASFEAVFQFYLMDKSLRILMTDALERIGVYLRTIIAHELGRHDPMAHLDRSNVIRSALAVRPKYISGAAQAWAEQHGIALLYIQPGTPQQNANIERYNRTVRYAWLAGNLFQTIERVQEVAMRWIWTYNNERPSMALGGITPVQKLTLAA